MSSEELKPCPFCGDTPGDDSGVLNDGGYKYGAIQCGCGAQGPDVRTDYKDWPEWKPKAVAEWNTRTQLEAIRAAGGEVDKHEAQPEVAENTGSHAMATNQLQRQEQAVDRDVEGVAALCEASLVNDIFAWATFDGEGSYDLRLFEENESYRDNFRRNNPKHHPDWVFPLYRHSIVAAMAAELEKARAEIEELDALRTRQSELLSQTAIAIRGPEPALTRYSHADIPSRVKSVVDELAAIKAQEPVAYVLFRDGEVCYEADNNIVISNVPGDETDLYQWLPVFALPPLAGKVSKRDASRAAIEKLRAMSHDELLAEVEALLATPSIEVKS